MTSRLPPSEGNKGIRTASLSWRGKRNSNQDRILIVAGDSSQDCVVAAVADGLGGMYAGDKAAEFAVRSVEESAGSLTQSMRVSFNAANDALMEAYDLANDRIRSHADSVGKPGQVGTTLTTLVICGGHYLVANIGDTRCYVIDDSSVRQITEDHTVAAALRKQGSLSDKDFRSSPYRHQLNRSLGSLKSCQTDIFPEQDFGRIGRTCTFLVCSDGFYSKLADEDLSPLRGDAGNLQDILQKLAEAALKRGSSDNISAVVVHCTP